LETSAGKILKDHRIFRKFVESQELPKAWRNTLNFSWETTEALSRDKPFHSQDESI
jgi:hypothetical protein